MDGVPQKTQQSGAPESAVPEAPANPSPAAGLWLVTGMTGAGGATAVEALRRAGVPCTDDLPPSLLAPLAAQPRTVTTAVVIDARRGPEVASLTVPPGTHVIFLDADDGTLVRRLADSTAPHPCTAAGVGPAAVRSERELLGGLREQADEVIDTTDLPPAEIGRRVVAAVRPDAARAESLVVTISSFGFKFGPQVEADWVIDVRFLPNPFWVAALRPLNGLDESVIGHVMSTDAGPELVSRLVALLGWVVDQVEAHGRRRLHVAIGCTGGRHRSVAVAGELARRLTAGGRVVTVRHRDLDRPDDR